jgi:hypothetical protein
MRPDGVVVVPPEGQLPAGICQAVEDLLVEAFVAQAAVEAFDEGVLLRLSGIDVVPLDTVFLRPFQDCLARELGAVARREEGLPIGYGRARSPQIAQRVAITGSQVSTVVLLNHTAEETGYDRHPFYRADLAGRHRHLQASP